jgi:hypothetical protein
MCAEKDAVEREAILGCPRLEKLHTMRSEYVEQPSTRSGDTIQWDSICIRGFFPFNEWGLKGKKI